MKAAYMCLKYIVVYCITEDAVVMRRIHCPRRVEGTGAWRKLHNEELHNLYTSPGIIITMDRMGREYSTNGAEEDRSLEKAA
jgi:hypothetical protein